MEKFCPFFPTYFCMQSYRLVEFRNVPYVVSLVIFGLNTDCLWIHVRGQLSLNLDEAFTDHLHSFATFSPAAIAQQRQPPENRTSDA